MLQIQDLFQVANLFTYNIKMRDYAILFSANYLKNSSASITPILRIGDQVLTFDVFWPKHLQEVRSTVYIHVQSI